LIGHPGGLRGKSYQSYGNDTDQNPLVVAPDVADVFGTVDVTPIDDEPPADMVNVPRDSTADLSPVAQESGFTRRLQTVADTMRPRPSVAPSSDELSRDEASAEAIGAHRDHTNDYEENTL
jgi:hypothetical protein